MASNVREKVMLESTGVNKKGKPTRFFYTKYKNKRNTPDKIEIKKYDPWAWNAAIQQYGMHVIFKEKKLPK